MPRVSKGTRVNQRHKPQSLPAKFKVGFLSVLDGRTDLAKALRASYEAVVNDIGGKDDVSTVKAALVERFVWLQAILQTLEHEMAQGLTDKAEAIGKWIQAVNALSGLAKVLGVDRKASSKPWMVPLLPHTSSREDEEPNGAAKAANGKAASNGLPCGFKELQSKVVEPWSHAIQEDLSDK